MKLSAASILACAAALVAARPQDGPHPGPGGPGGPGGPHFNKGDLTCPTHGGQAILQLACPSHHTGGHESGHPKPTGPPPSHSPPPGMGTETVYASNAPTVTVTATSAPGIDCSGCSSVSVVKPTCSKPDGMNGGMHGSHSHPPASVTVTEDTKTITEPAAPTCTS